MENKNVNNNDFLNFSESKDDDTVVKVSEEVKIKTKEHKPKKRIDFIKTNVEGAIGLRSKPDKKSDVNVIIRPGEIENLKIDYNNKTNGFYKVIGLKKEAYINAKLVK